MKKRIEAYRTAAIEASKLSDVRRQNRAADELHTVALSIRGTSSGRDAILGLLKDEEPFVRLAAATEALKWAPELASPVLEQLVAADGAGAFDAKWTLRLYREGKLNLDY